jgi:signal transduction histidine kinase
MKLFTKYNRFNLMVMALLFVLSGGIHYLLINKVLVDEIDEALGKYQHQVRKYAREHNVLPVFRNFEEVQVNYHVIDGQREQEIRQVHLYNPEDRSWQDFRQLTFSARVKGTWYEVAIAKPLDGTTLLTQTIVYSTLAILLFIIIVSILLNHIILRKLWQPFYTAMKEMKGFKLGNKQEPLLPETDIEEFSFMNQSLYQAISGAKDDYRILKEFTENASHETQTPLAIIRSKLDLVIQEEGLSEGQSEALRSAYAAVSRLAKLNQSLLLLAKIENQQFRTVAPINLKEKIEEKLQQFNEFWAGNRIGINCTLNPSVIEANPELIDVLLNNLLSNAGRHNIEGGEISISLMPGKLQIANTAKLNSLDPKKLFSRFYKEAQHSKHTGLGLSIVKQICDESGMTITYGFFYQQHSFTLEWLA